MSVVVGEGNCQGLVVVVVVVKRGGTQGSLCNCILAAGLVGELPFDSQGSQGIEFWPQCYPGHCIWATGLVRRLQFDHRP